MLVPNPKLALAIPTYNRAEVLEQNLRCMLPDLKKLGVPVYISDDSTDFETQNRISELVKDYPLVFYRHNKLRLGHDDNFFSTLEMPDTDYVWYLGDSVFVRPGGFLEVLKLLEHEPDFCFVNAYVKNRPNEHIESDQIHGFLLDRTWYLTLSGATIYGRKARSLPMATARKKQWKNFPQLGLILEYCSLKKVRCEWIGEPLIEINQNKKSYWEKQAFSVFVRDWSVLIRSFPKLFNKAEADRVIRSHSAQMGLFGCIGLFKLRAKKSLNFAILKEYESDFRVASGSYAWAKLFCCVPSWFCKLCWWVADALRRTFKKVLFRA